MIYLVTSNRNKVKEFKEVLEPKIKVEQIEMEYPELRSDDPEEIVKLAAKQLSNILKKAVVVEDSGFFIRALNGFPGTCTKYIYERIGNKGFLKLMKNVKDRTCYYKSAIGYCEPGKEPVSFSGIEEGKVSEKEKGDNGWGQDSIFIPKDKDKTYGEISGKKFRKQAILKLKKFLKLAKFTIALYIIC